MVAFYEPLELDLYEILTGLDIQDGSFSQLVIDNGDQRGLPWDCQLELLHTASSCVLDFSEQGRVILKGNHKRSPLINNYTHYEELNRVLPFFLDLSGKK